MRFKVLDILDYRFIDVFDIRLTIIYIRLV